MEKDSKSICLSDKRETSTCAVNIRMSTTKRKTLNYEMFIPSRLSIRLLMERKSIMIILEMNKSILFRANLILAI